MKKTGSAPPMAAMAVDWLESQHPDNVEKLGNGQFGEVLKAGSYAVKIMKASSCFATLCAHEIQ